MSVDNIRHIWDVQQIVDDGYSTACQFLCKPADRWCVDGYLVLPLRKAEGKIPDDDFGARSQVKTNICNEDFQRNRHLKISSCQDIADNLLDVTPAYDVAVNSRCSALFTKRFVLWYVIWWFEQPLEWRRQKQ